MNNLVIGPVDWNATAAWIALIISVVGTVIGPIVTASLNNTHQLKMYDIQRTQKRMDERECLFKAAIASVGAATGELTPETLTGLGRDLHNVYAFIPFKDWKSLDSFFYYACTYDREHLRELCPSITSLLVRAMQQI